jgi:hypothetical protein
MRSLYPPIFSSPGNGIIPVVTLDGNDFQLEFFSTNDGGNAWMQIASASLGQQVGDLAIANIDRQDLLIPIPNSDQILRLVKGKLQTIVNKDGKSALIVDLIMVSTEAGWAKWNLSNCTSMSIDKSSVQCITTTQLLKTSDGGFTWHSILLPETNSDEIVIQSTISNGDSLEAQVTATGGSNTQIFIGQGFDKCEIPTLSQLQTWWNSSPFKIVNFYIGGVNRSCNNSALAASYITQIRQQGWAFAPVWDGPHSPCVIGISGARFSYDVATAYSQGVNEANLAVDRLAELGLTNSDKTGSVIYYDMEKYSSDTACRNAVNSFVNGWVSQLHARGNLAGVYGSTGCNEGLKDYLNIENIPDVIWPAIWAHSNGFGSYDPNASVWNPWMS